MGDEMGDGRAVQQVVPSGQESFHRIPYARPGGAHYCIHSAQTLCPGSLARTASNAGGFGLALPLI